MSDLIQALSGISFLLGAAIAFAVAVFWVFQFVALMSTEDDELPGQHARIVWAAAFIVLWFIAPFAFWVWRGRQKTSPISSGSSRRRTTRSNRS